MSSIDDSFISVVSFSKLFPHSVAESTTAEDLTSRPTGFKAMDADILGKILCMIIFPYCKQSSWVFGEKGKYGWESFMSQTCPCGWEYIFCF